MEAREVSKQNAQTQTRTSFIRPTAHSNYHNARNSKPSDQYPLGNVFILTQSPLFFTTFSASMDKGLKDLRISLERDFPKVRPENTVGEYAVSKNENKAIKYANKEAETVVNQ